MHFVAKPLGTNSLARVCTYSGHVGRSFAPLSADMTTHWVHLRHTVLALGAIGFLIPGVASAQSQSSKFDDSLRELIANGCTGTKSVIIRTTPGSRETLRKSLLAQGRRVKGEFPALDAITAEVSCADLDALAAFRETASISDNVKVHGHQLDSLIGPIVTETTIDDTTLAAFVDGSTSTYTSSFSTSLWSRLMEALSVQQLQTSFFS